MALLADTLTFDHLCLSPDEVDLVIYHGKCSDGFGSALAAYTYFKPTDGKNKNGKMVEYFGASFYQAPPDVTGKNVIICDFSYKSAVTATLLEQASKLVILDHHKSAESELKSVPDENKIFDMTHSGAYITWRYFFGNTPVPTGILYIEDNDIWTKKMPMTREVTSYIYSLPFEFTEYEKILDDVFLTNIAMQVGTGMVKQNDIYISQALMHCCPKFVAVGSTYYFVVHCNSTVLKSEIGNTCLTKFMNADFSTIYSVGDDEFFFSMRSMDDRADVSLIASKFGGGGHRNASGMSSGSMYPYGKVIDDYRLYNALNTIYFNKLVVGDDSHNIVYMNYSGRKRHIGAYLLQTRSTTKTGEIIQQCYSIAKNMDSEIEHTTADIAAIWNYDGNKKKTQFTMIFKTGLDLETKLRAKYREYSDFSMNANKIVFSVNGCMCTL
jgi:oligoribonuclease NrnB/cAMP/cGMP phosphodiesterase (DHH superfamily)